MVALESTTHHPLSETLNARARRSLLRVVGADTARIDATPDDALADFIAELRLELDTRGDLRAAIDGYGRPAAASHEQDAFPSYGSFDHAFTHQLED